MDGHHRHCHHYSRLNRVVANVIDCDLTLQHGTVKCGSVNGCRAFGPILFPRLTDVSAVVDVRRSHNDHCQSHPYLRPTLYEPYRDPPSIQLSQQ